MKQVYLIKELNHSNPSFILNNSDLLNIFNKLLAININYVILLSCLIGIAISIFILKLSSSNT